MPLTGAQEKKALEALKRLVNCKERKDMVAEICLAGGGTMGPKLYLTKGGLEIRTRFSQPSGDASGLTSSSTGQSTDQVRPSLDLVKEFEWLDEHSLNRVRERLKA